MEADFAGLTIIEDDGDDGLLLLAAYAKKFLKRNYRFLCIADNENVESLFKTVLGDKSLSMLRIDHDPLGWDDGSGEGILRDRGGLTAAVLEQLNEDSDRPTVVLIPSFSWIWLVFGHKEAMRFVVRVRRASATGACPPRPVIALIKGHLLTSAQSDHWRHVSTTLMHPTAAIGRNVPSETVLRRMRVAFAQKKGHKLNEKVFAVEITSTFDMLSSAVMGSVQAAGTTDQDQPDPTAGLTFNMKLKDDEAAARKNVQLPHIVVRDSMKKQIRGSGQVAVVQDAQIHYIPDEADDFDEEDPDADLDI